MNTNSRSLLVAIGTAAALAACGGGEPAGGAALQATSAADDQPSGVCGLLSQAQVDAVIPGNDGGQEQDASLEEAMLTDVAVESCRYLHVEGTDLQYLDLIVYKASSDEGFEQISIGKWAHQGSSRQLDFGDLGFLLDMSDQNEMEATVSKGRTVIELKLNADDAPTKSEQLIGLARTVTGKI